MTYQSLSEKNNVLLKMIEVAKSDGNVSPAELTYLVWTSKKLNVSQGELQQLFTGAAMSSNPIQLKSRVELFHKCLSLACIDAKFQKSESDTCLKIAKDLRLDELKTNKVIADIALQGEVMDLEKLISNYC